MVTCRIRIVYRRVEKDPNLGDAKCEVFFAVTDTRESQHYITKKYAGEPTDFGDDVYGLVVREVDAIIVNYVGENAHIVSVNENITVNEMAFIFYVRG